MQTMLSKQDFMLVAESSAEMPLLRELHDRLKVYNFATANVMNRRGISLDPYRYFSKLGKDRLVLPLAASKTISLALMKSGHREIADAVAVLGSTAFKLELSQDEFSVLCPLLEYRHDAISNLPKLLSWKHGVLQAPMGIGKTVLIGLTCYLIAKQLPGARGAIITQSSQDAKSFKRSLEADSFILDHVDVEISSRGTFDASTPIDYIIFDECHRMTSKTAAAIINNTPAIYKYGFTGTYPTDKEKALVLNSLLGYKTTVSTMRVEMDKGRLQEAIVKILTLPRTVKHDIDSWAQERNWIANDSFRNKAILEVVKSLMSEKRNILIFTDLLIHTDKLSNMMTAENMPHSVIRGGWKDADIQLAREKAKEGNGSIILSCWKVFAEAKNVPELDAIVVASSIKAEETVKQSIGRVIRKGGAAKSLVVDFRDSAYRYWNKHLNGRLKIYRELELQIKQL